MDIFWDTVLQHGHGWDLVLQHGHSLGTSQTTKICLGTILTTWTHLGIQSNNMDICVGPVLQHGYSLGTILYHLILKIQPCYVMTLIILK